MEIASRALHTTSDFPNILLAVANKRLRPAYQQSPSTYRLWARRGPNAPDFKQINVMQLGSAPALEKVGENGEFKYGTIKEGTTSYSIVTYGKIIGVTRQTIINDDLRALDRLPAAFGAAAARLENMLVYMQLTTNPNMSDGVALFHTATHGNLASSGGAIADGTLAAGRAAMRGQKDIDGQTVLNLAPAFLITGAVNEQDAYKWTSPLYTPAKPGDVNEFRAGGRTALTPIIDGTLDGLTGAKHWFLAADPMQIDTVEYCYLDGEEGPHLESRIGFEIDGVELKARLDFVAKVIDYRGLYKNPHA